MCRQRRFTTERLDDFENTISSIAIFEDNLGSTSVLDAFDSRNMSRVEADRAWELLQQSTELRRIIALTLQSMRAALSADTADSESFAAHAEEMYALMMRLPATAESPPPDPADKAMVVTDGPVQALPTVMEVLVASTTLTA
jgi:hypothetical protein